VSQRGAFCTEYMYCAKCAQAVVDNLDKLTISEYKTVISAQVAGSETPLIVAAKMHGSWMGEEIMEGDNLEVDLGKFLCPGHAVRFAVMADGALKGPEEKFYWARGPHNPDAPKYAPCRCEDCAAKVATPA